jgi:hypothetical protein
MEGRSVDQIGGTTVGGHCANIHCFMLLQHLCVNMASAQFTHVHCHIGTQNAADEDHKH